MYEDDPVLDSDIPDLLLPPKRNRKQLKFKSKSKLTDNLHGIETPEIIPTLDQLPISGDVHFLDGINLDDSDSLPDILA
jgi:hypothetical protein